MGIVRAHDVGVVVLVGRPFTADIFHGNPDAEADGFAFEVDGVARRPVGTPTSSQAFLVGEFYGVLHVDDTCRKGIASDGAVEEHVDIGIAMAGILCVAIVRNGP